MGDFVKSDAGAAVLTVAAVAGAAYTGGSSLALLTASTAGTLVSTRKSAGARQVEVDLAARAEKQDAQDREVQRKRRVNAVLGAQRAAAAASGLAMSGSVANISITDAKRAAEDSFADRLNTGARIDALGRQRKSIGRAATYQNATTILGAASRADQRGLIPGGKGGGKNADAIAAGQN